MVSTISYRRAELQEFLLSSFYKGFQSCAPLQGDAGCRLYYRIKTRNKSYILMDCPPTYCRIEPFIKMAEHLRSQNFSSPEIFYFDTKRGFIILEDFGEVSIKNVIQNSLHNLSRYREIYCSILDLLVLLEQTIPSFSLKVYDNNLLLSELKLFTDWYILYRLKRNLSATELDDFKDIWQRILNYQVILNHCLVLRDYHVENVMYLKNCKGIKSLGLLDFQDAVIGSPIYDVVSVLEDARIKVPRTFALDCLKYFAGEKKLKLPDVLVDYHILGAQRNLRILGVFARKYVRDKNSNYLRYIPLVLEYLNYDLSHPIMSKLKNWFDKIINSKII